MRWRRFRRRADVKRLKFTYRQDGEFYIGFLNDYPDCATQGLTKEELVENLKDLLKDIESGEIPYICKVEELVVAWPVSHVPAPISIGGGGNARTAATLPE